MTKNVLASDRKNNLSVTVLISFVTVFVLLYFSESIAENIRYGIRLAAFSVIPSVFPFLVFSDYLSANTYKISRAKWVSKLFSIPSGCEGAIFSGLICGFPCGVKHAVSLYENKSISNAELERIIGLVNNPSLAFVVSGVGIGMLHRPSEGVVLFLSIIISVIITAVIFKNNETENVFLSIISEQKYNFTKSIKNAGISSLTISTYIVFFSALIGIIKSFPLSGIILSIFASLLEIGNAVALINSFIQNELISFMLFGFALGFSGLSVHLQVFDLLPEGTSVKKYLVMKLTEGLLCGLISVILKIFLHKLNIVFY